MTWDIKLGLLVGVGVVVAAALVYYQPESVARSKVNPKEAAKAQIKGGFRTIQLSPMPASTTGRDE